MVVFEPLVSQLTVTTPAAATEVGETDFGALIGGSFKLDTSSTGCDSDSNKVVTGDEIRLALLSEGVDAADVGDGTSAAGLIASSCCSMTGGVGDVEGV